MPMTGLLPAKDVLVVETWIAEGALDVCGGPIETETGAPAGYHPDGFESPDVHGLEAKLQTQQCVTCHGDDLMGGDVGVSCDTCHTKGWRADCTFCHGGDETPDGAPPRDIDGNSDPASITFPPHTAHVTTNIHLQHDCTECHVKPTDVLSIGHLFLGDSTPAASEVNFTAGLSSLGSYTPSSCSNLYCHGNGQATGSVTVATGSAECDACHADITSGEDAWDRMSGEHEKHIDEGLLCSECHGATVSGTSTIIDPAQHVDGEKDILLVPSMTYAGGRCTGTCHGETHSSRSW
jgi:predicted CxxxxCH...CXXCH cytochrome family protein